MHIFNIFNFNIEHNLYLKFNNIYIFLIYVMYNYKIYYFEKNKYKCKYIIHIDW